MTQFPHVNQALVAALDELFPDKCPDPELSTRQVWVNAGSAKVVRFLKMKLEEQSHNLLNSKEI